MYGTLYSTDTRYILFEVSFSLEAKGHVNMVSSVSLNSCKCAYAPIFKQEVSVNLKTQST